MSIVDEAVDRVGKSGADRVAIAEKATSVRVYNERTFAAVFVKAGFELRATFVCDAMNGHIIHNRNQLRSTDAKRVGVVVRKPLAHK